MLKIYAFMAFIIVTLCLSLSEWAIADDLCGTAPMSWASDGDGSLQLTYRYDKERLELIHREDEGVLVARGLLDAKGLREVYAIYDLSTGILVNAVARHNVDKGLRDKTGFSRKYSMESYFDIKTYAASDSFKENFRKILTENSGKSCHEELVKRKQGRDYDKERCGEVFRGLNTIMATLVRPGTALKETTENAQVAKYIGGFRERRGRDYCTGVQQMAMYILDDLKNPDTQKKLAVRRKMPAYLEPEQKSFEKGSYEQYRY